MPEKKRGLLILLLGLNLAFSGCGGGGGGAQSTGEEGGNPASSASYSFQSAESAYKVTLLGRPGNDSFATAVNELGQVAGNYMDENNTTSPFLWEDGDMRSIARAAMARDINARGEIVGYTLSEGETEAFLYNGDLFLLNPYGGKSRAFQINDSGYTVGRRTLSGESAFIERAGSFQIILPDVRGYATAIGNGGEVAVRELKEDGGSRALLWNDGALTDLGALGGDETYVTAINGSGQVVGWSQTENGEYHAFLWEEGRMVDLGRSGEKSSAVAVNDLGQVLVRASGPTSAGAYLWEDGRTVDLGNFGAEFAQVNDMNANGDIVGWLFTEDMKIRAFLARKIQS